MNLAVHVDKQYRVELDQSTSDRVEFKFRKEGPTSGLRHHLFQGFQDDQTREPIRPGSISKRDRTTPTICPTDLFRPTRAACSFHFIRNGGLSNGKFTDHSGAAQTTGGHA